MYKAKKIEKSDEKGIGVVVVRLRVPYIVKMLTERLMQMASLWSPHRLSLIKHVEDRLGHYRRYGIDPIKIKNELGWYPETPFEVGIVKTIDWYLENEEWMKRVSSGAYQRYYVEMYKNKQ